MWDSRSLSSTLGLLAIAALGAPRLIAQGGATVAGHVVDEATGAPVAGGFVVLLDARGREVGRTLAGADGRFVLRAPGPGAYRLGSERIGYRATLSPPFDLTGERRAERLVVQAVGVELAAVTVTERSDCRARPDEDAGTAAAWDEVRKALAATEWTGRSAPYRYRTAGFERDWDEGRRTVLAETADTVLGTWRAPFASVPAARLVTRGFIVAGADSTMYYGPDAVVLRDSAFLAAHCFALLRRVRRGARELGLSFTPVPRRTVPDIRGVLWLDEATAELRSLEFSYTRVPGGVADDRVGGSVDFLRLPTGAWIVRRWELRLPRIGAQVFALPSGPSTRRLSLVGFHDTGGEVLDIWSAAGARLYPPPAPREGEGEGEGAGGASGPA